MRSRWNSNKPFTTFSGQIIKKYSHGNVLTCELTSVEKKAEKRLYLLNHIDPDASKDLYLGCYLRHTDQGKVYAGSFIIEKIKSVILNTNTHPQTISFVRNPAKKLESAILDYLYDFNLNMLKIPSAIYDEIGFSQWLNEKQNKRGKRMPEYDLFIAAPIKGFNKQIEQYNKLKNEIENVMPNSEKENSAITAEIDGILKKHILGSTQHNNTISLKDMRLKIINMISKLKGEEFGFKKIYYSAEKEAFSIDRKTDPSKALEVQLSHFSVSKRILILLPYPMISSVFVEAGWAMISDKNIPVLIVANKKDLPHLLQKADTLKNRRIQIVSWEEVGDIEEIPNWILDNDWHKIRSI